MGGVLLDLAAQARDPEIDRAIEERKAEKEKARKEEDCQEDWKVNRALFQDDGRGGWLHSRASTRGRGDIA